MDEGQGSGTGAGAGRSVPVAPLISDQRDCSEAPPRATGALPRKQSETSGSIRKGKPIKAKVSLNDITDVPKYSRQVILSSKDPNRKLTNINPFKVKAKRDRVCGNINKQENFQSASILLHTTSFHQTKIILKITQFYRYLLSEFQDESPEETLKCFQSCGVVEVRKMYNDLRKFHKPIFDFTFFGQASNKIPLGYIRRRVTTFYPTPERFNNCHRLNHKTNRCMSKATCSYCSSTQHSRTQCTADAPNCINCYGAHETTSRIFPKVKFGKDVYTITAEQGISFVEAREQQMSDQIRSSTQTSTDNPAPSCSDTTSQSQFPGLGLSKRQQSQKID